MVAQVWDEITTAGPRAIPALEASNVDQWTDAYTKAYERRRVFLSNFSFAVPTCNAIISIAAFVDGRKLLEVGAGSGLWSKLLHDIGVDVVAVDDVSWNLPQGFQIKHGTYWPIEKMDGIEAVKKYRECKALLLCWPPYNDPIAYQALRAFKGDRLIYIGEGYGGCTGDDKFHDLREKKWDEERYVEIPQWEGIHDGVYLHKRKSS